MVFAIRELGSPLKAVSPASRPRCPNPLARKVDYEVLGPSNTSVKHVNWVKLKCKMYTWGGPGMPQYIPHGFLTKACGFDNPENALLGVRTSRPPQWPIDLHCVLPGARRRTLWIMILIPFSSWHILCFNLMLYTFASENSNFTKKHFHQPLRHQKKSKCDVFVFLVACKYMYWKTPVILNTPVNYF